MKTKTFTVDPQTGAVSLVGPFSHGLSALEVKANTKGEAIAQILAQAATRAKAGGPTVHFLNGAYALVYHTGTGYAIETGTTHPRRKMLTDGAQMPLCESGDTDKRKALADTSLAYYGSEEFQAQERTHFGANGTTEAELIATLRQITEAVGKVNASEAARLGLVMPHASALATLGKYTGSPVPCGQSPVVREMVNA